MPERTEIRGRVVALAVQLPTGETVVAVAVAVRRERLCDDGRMRTLMLALAIAAAGCGGGESLVQCDHSWDFGEDATRYQCEDICVGQGSEFLGRAPGSDTCTAQPDIGSAPAGHCPVIAEVDGRRGCCEPSNESGDGASPIQFYECQ